MGGMFQEKILTGLGEVEEGGYNLAGGVSQVLVTNPGFAAASLTSRGLLLE